MLCTVRRVALGRIASSMTEQYIAVIDGGKALACCLPFFPGKQRDKAAGKSTAKPG